jgi:hypothetical protein
MKNQFISTLSNETQENIKKDLILAFTELELTQEEIQETLENALNSRLSDLEDTININKYL